MTGRPHANARTSAEVRQAIRESSESLKVLARRYGINPKTVAKWKKRASVDDLQTGPKPGRQRKLNAEEEEFIVALRQQTLLPLDDCLYSLQARIPHLSRTSLHRCFQRHGISRLPQGSAGREGSRHSETEPIGCFHIDKAEVHSADGTFHLFTAVDQASKFAFVQLVKRAGSAEAAGFLEALVAAIPFRINTVLTLDARPFAVTGRQTRFVRLCRELGIEHRLTTATHPWARRRGKRLGQMVQDRALYDNEAYLMDMLRVIVVAYNYRRRLKTLGGRTPQEFICHSWLEEPHRFLRDPHHEIVGPEIMRG